MPKLNQINAIEKSTKTRAYEAVSEAHKTLQKEAVFNGVSRTYRPKDDDPSQPTGEKLPSEEQKVTSKATDIIKATVEQWAALLDVSATRDYGNCMAKADIVVDGKTLMKDVPVVFLLFLEKQLNDLETFVKKLPTLSASESWSYDDNQDLYATKPFETTRTKKHQRPMVLYEATKEHPAQVKEVTEDILCGYWSTIKYSGALPVSRVNEMRRRVEQLQQAVKFAREKANEVEVSRVSDSRAVLDFVFST